MYIIDLTLFYYCPLFLFSFGGDYIFNAQSRCATGSPPLYFLPILFFCVSFSTRLHLQENVLLFSPTPMQPSHFDIFSLGVVLPFGSVWIKMSDSTLINEFLTQQKDFGWNAGGWLEKEKRPRLYLLHNPSKRHKLFIQWLFPVSLFISLSAPSETNQWTLRRRRKKKKKNFERQPVFLLSALYSVFRCETRVEKEQKPSTEFSFIFPSKKQKMSWNHQLDKKIRSVLGPNPKMCANLIQLP